MKTLKTIYGVVEGTKSKPELKLVQIELSPEEIDNILHGLVLVNAYKAGRYFNGFTASVEGSIEVSKLYMGLKRFGTL